MSLINDALKRASGKPPAAHPDLPAPVPVTPAPDERRAPLQAWILAGVAILLVIVAVVLLRKKPEQTQAAARTAPVQQTAPAVEAPVTAANPLARAAATLEKVADRNQEGTEIAQTMAKAPEPIVTAKPESKAAGKTEAKAAPGPVVEAKARVPSPVARPVEPAGFPEVRLQAIYYRMNFPTAVLNGKTLSPGDELEGGAKLLTINREAVEVEYKGEKRTFSMK